MALPVLDGNQSATTLSSVVTGGEHIVAHTVVSLGSTAISNITSAVSGIPVSGTVTANIFGFDSPNDSFIPITIQQAFEGLGSNTPVVGVQIANENGHISGANPFNVSGTVTVGMLTAENSANSFPNQQPPVQLKANSGDGALRVRMDYVGAAVSDSSVIGYKDNEINAFSTVTYAFLKTHVNNSVTIGSLPRVTFIDGSGSVTTANSAITVFASSTTRSYLLVQVTTGSAFVNVGATATTVNGINLTAGQGYAWETTIPQGLVSLISTTTSSRWVAKEA
jgi:hypothetical protein